MSKKFSLRTAVKDIWWRELASQVLNILTLGRWGSTFSARTARCATYGKFPGNWFWCRMERSIDWAFVKIFGPSEAYHCTKEWMVELRDRKIVWNRVLWGQLCRKQPTKLQRVATRR